MNAEMAAKQDWLTAFRQGIVTNTEAWLRYVQVHQEQMTMLKKEWANLSKAVRQSLAERMAWLPGLELTQALWPHVEMQGHWQDWQRLLETALVISQQAGHPAATAQLLDQLGDLARMQGDNEAALTRQEQALKLYRERGDQRGTASVLAHLSQVHLTRSEYDTASRYCQEAAAIFETLDDPAGQALAYNNWGAVCIERQQWGEALKHLSQTQQLRERLKDLRGQAKAIHNQGRVYRHTEQWDQAIDCYRQAAAMHREAGDEVNVARSQVGISIVWHEQGQTARALKQHQQLEPLFRRLGDRPWLARVVNNQGVFLAALGHPQEAQTAYEQAVRLHLANGSIAYAVDSLHNCAELLLDRQRVGEAKDCLERARKHWNSLRDPPDWLWERHEKLIRRVEQEGK